MTSINAINNFLSNTNIAVIGVSRNKKKFGYIVFNCLRMRKGRHNVFPVNPHISEIDGMKCFSGIDNLPENVKAAIFITQPDVTENITEIICKSEIIRHLWFQPGSESRNAIETALKSGKNTIHNECILMFASPSGFPHNMHGFFKKMFGKYPR